MQTAFVAWHDKRQRHLPRDLFASIPLARALFGGKPHTNPEAAVKEAGKEDKEHNKQSKAEKEDSKAKKPETITEQLKEQQEIRAEQQADKPTAARIVAYSDSEGEDEPFRLTRRRRQKKEEEEQTEVEEEAEQPAAEPRPPPQRASVHAHKNGSRGFRTLRACSKRGASKLGQDAGWGLLLQFFVLWLCRRKKWKLAQRLELLTLAISVPDAFCLIASLQGRRCPSSRLPGKLRWVARFVESWARPAAVYQLEQLAHFMLPKKKRRRILATISQSVRVFEEAELSAKSPGRLYERAQPPPRLASEGAALYKIELAEMKRILDDQGIKLPAERFDDTNAELLRFAAAAGLLQASSAEEKAHAIQEGAQRILKTVDWLRKHRFMPPAQLKEWQHMVRWQGSDIEGWPILVIKIAKACAKCQGDDAESVAEAVISQLQRAMTDLFSNQHGPDKLVVVLDATAANSLQAARNVNLFKRVATTLDRHYPNRLHQLFIVGLPPQLRWVLATMKPLLQPQTKEKIRSISISDPALPLPEQVLQEPRLESNLDAPVGDGSSSNPDSHRSRRVSIPELPVSQSPPSLSPTSSRSRSSLLELRGQGEAARRAGADSHREGEQERPRRRARIMELPFRESGPRPSPRNSLDRNDKNEGAFSPGSVLRPVLKRSASAGLLGMGSQSGELSDINELGSELEY